MTVNFVDTLYFKITGIFCTGKSAGGIIIRPDKEVSIMTIKEVEKQTGLPRSNIRFYEKEKLLEPSRNDQNGYRNYTEKDIEMIKKIAWLRTLEISIDDIRRIISGNASLMEIVEKQMLEIRERMEGLNQAKIMCERMLEAGNISFDELQIEKYVTDLPGYWKDNKAIFRPDSVRFLHLWGSFLTWAAIALLCFLTGILSYGKLPAQIPVQWNHEAVATFVSRKFIFAYPLACIIIRIMIRPMIYARLLKNHLHGALISEYLSNYLCFIALSVEIFSVLYVYGLAKSIVTVLLIDTVVLIGLLSVGMAKIGFSPT